MTEKKNPSAAIKGPSGMILTKRADKMKEYARRGAIAATMANRANIKVTLPKFSWDKKDDEQ